MPDHEANAHCPLCVRPVHAAILSEAAWMDAATERRLKERHPHWRKSDGACPACVQHALLSVLLERGEAAMGRAVQQIWPIDAEAAFGALPTPLRMRADPRFTGAGVTVAVIDAAFHPHDDLVRPVNRIRAWVDASSAQVVVRRFRRDERPQWPSSEVAHDSKWHGLMTSVALAGNGWRSHGLYRGLAPDAEMVLIQVQAADGRIGSTRVARALRWLLAEHVQLGVRVVNVSLGVSAETADAAQEIDGLVAALSARNVSVVVASGNDGDRSLALPATAPLAITVGGLDDMNVLDLTAQSIWHSNYGVASGGGTKPELVAPSMWVAAPVLPGSAVAREALALFSRRAADDASADVRLAALRLVTPHYQHVEGTSFASPIVSGVVACMLEASPTLPAGQVCSLLRSACHEVPGATMARQGAGAIDAGRAVAAALAARYRASATSVPIA
jgi:serine protease AprX